MRRDLQLDLLETVAHRRIERRARDFEATAGHRELLHRGRDAIGELAGREAPLA
jgi:hypothetical protein